MSFPVYKNGLIQFTGLSGTGQGPIVGVTNVTLSTGIKPVEGMAAGQITPSFVGIMSAEPTITVTLYDIGTMLTNGIGTAPLPFGSGQTCTGITVWGVQAQEDGEIVMSGSNQVGVEYVVAQGMAIFTSCSARQGSPATVTMTIYAESTDGVTDPITVTSGVNLPSIPVLGQMYTVGQSEINGSTLSSTNSIDYAGNWQIRRDGSNGNVFATETYASQYKPTLTIGSYDASLYGTYGGSLGTALGSSSFVCYLQAIQPNAGRYTPVTTKHVKIAGSASQGMVWAEQSTLQPDTGECRLHICPVVGSSVVLAMSLAAIT